MTEQVRDLIRSGVQFNCYALDPDYEPGVRWVEEQGDEGYRRAALRARTLLEKEGRFHDMEHYRGRLHYHTYRRVPEFWCLGVDVDDPVDGRMFYAPYLMNNLRSENPTFAVSRISEPDLFDKFMRTVNIVRKHSTDPRFSVPVLSRHEGVSSVSG